MERRGCGGGEIEGEKYDMMKIKKYEENIIIFN